MCLYHESVPPVPQCITWGPTVQVRSEVLAHRLCSQLELSFGSRITQCLSATGTVVMDRKPVNSISSKFAAGTKLRGVVYRLEGKDGSQRDIARLEEWASANLMEFNRAECRLPRKGTGAF